MPFRISYNQEKLREGGNEDDTERILYKRPLSRLGPEKDILEEGCCSDLYNHEEDGKVEQFNSQILKMTSLLRNPYPVWRKFGSCMRE